MKIRFILAAAVLLILNGCLDTVHPGVVAGNPDIDEESYQDPFAGPGGQPDLPNDLNDGPVTDDSAGSTDDGPADGVQKNPDDPESAQEIENIPGGDRIHEENQSQTVTTIPVKPDAAPYPGWNDYPVEMTP